MHTPDYDHTYYLTNAIRVDCLRQRVKEVAEALAGVEFTSIAFRGMSGALFAAPLALLMDKTLLGVRKDFEISENKCHSYHMVEGDTAAKSYIIIDDCINSGSTVRDIRRKVHKFAPDARFVGVFVYDSMLLKTRADYSEPFWKVLDVPEIDDAVLPLPE